MSIVVPRFVAVGSHVGYVSVEGGNSRVYAMREVRCEFGAVPCAASRAPARVWVTPAAREVLERRAHYVFPRPVLASANGSARSGGGKFPLRDAADGTRRYTRVPWGRARRSGVQRGPYELHECTSAFLYLRRSEMATRRCRDGCSPGDVEDCEVKPVAAGCSAQPHDSLH